MSGRPDPDETGELIGIEELAKFFEDEAEPDEVPPEDEPGAAPVPAITRMPEGIEVKERHIGRAFGHWVLQVRCECGRRWFELEPVKAGKCPRCGSLVLIEIDKD